MDNCLIGDNELIFTASKGRLPGVSCHFSKDQYKLHTQKLQIDNLIKKIEIERKGAKQYSIIEPWWQAASSDSDARSKN